MGKTAEEYVEILCPELAQYHDAKSFIDLAKTLTSSGFFGDMYEYAVALRAAHLYTIFINRQGEGGSVVQKTEGRVSITYSTDRQSSDNELSTTAYGLQLLSLMKNKGTVGIIVGNTDIYNNFLGG